MRGAAALVEGTLETDLVPAPLELAALLPRGHESPAEPLPLLYLLHGGNGDRDFLEQVRPLVERAWDSGTLPPLVAVTPSADRSLYMDYRDGSERWESLLVGPLLEHVRKRYPVCSERSGTAVAGISMGGMGGLRLAFKHPERFCAVAALEPGVEPALAYRDIEPRDRFWRDEALFERTFGRPVDEAYWQANNPANLAGANAERIARSGLAIYLECGDEDSFGLHRGTEFLHRILFDAGLPHEYRLVRGADHLGASLEGRFLDALRFVGAALRPPPPDESLRPLHELIRALKRRAGVAD